MPIWHFSICSWEYVICTILCAFHIFNHLELADGTAPLCMQFVTFVLVVNNLLRIYIYLAVDIGECHLKCFWNAFALQWSLVARFAIKKRWQPQTMMAAYCIYRIYYDAETMPFCMLHTEHPILNSNSSETQQHRRRKKERKARSEALPRSNWKAWRFNHFDLKPHVDGNQLARCHQY